jgi:hypothetical protein
MKGSCAVDLNQNDAIDFAGTDRITWITKAMGSNIDI